MFKIAFLFLTISNINHENYWRDFFRGHEDTYNIYVHAKESVSNQSWFKQFELPYKLENTWARTMKCQIGMLKEALKNSDNQMFIFCSHNTIPLQSLDMIYHELMSSKKSVFRYEKNPHTDPNNKDAYQSYRVLKPIPEAKQYKNTQWVILNRKHAQMMVDDTQIIPIISHYPHDQEHYPSTFLHLHNMLPEVLKKETTLVVWHMDPQPPYVFKDLNNKAELQLLLDAITYGTYFVRKVDEACDLKPLDRYLTYRQ